MVIFPLFYKDLDAIPFETSIGTRELKLFVGSFMQLETRYAHEYYPWRLARDLKNQLLSNVAR